MRAYMSQLGNADECQQAFEVLRALTICDPTVGSGAFLFAAIDVLEPLYSEVLARAEELERKGSSTPEFLSEARVHPNPGYWLIKTICLHNLFGVDLMREAPEIAKLRLFLKLASQIEQVDDLEPLPDLDFNIKSGNLLVGIADYTDFQDRLGGTLEAAARLEDINTLAAEVATAYDEFVTDQAKATEADFAERKRMLGDLFDDTRKRCHELLHEVRGTTSFEQWIESHQPFHWFVEFPSVWRNDGFDVVIGNPPYIKKSTVTDYNWSGYETEKCPDLYALCMERATTLLNKQGRFAMIVMHSLCFSWKFSSLREFLEKQLGSIWVSSFARRPDSLFAGSAAVRNSIVCASVDSGGQIRTTGARRWQPSARTSLFSRIAYASPEKRCGHHPQWPFMDPGIADALHKLVVNNATIAESLVSRSPYALGYKTTALYQLGLYVTEPPTVDPNTGEPAETSSSRTGWMHFRSFLERDVALVSLAGRWGYLWWLIYGDEFHVTRRTLAAFPGDIARLANPAPGDMELESLLALSITLQEEMLNHLVWMPKAGVKVGRYNMLKLRHITDQADWFLATAWGLDEQAFEAAGNLRDRMIFGNKE